MKYIVYVTAPIQSQIRGDNLRGEGRWERNVLDALVSSGREVYLVDFERYWLASLDKKPENLKPYSELKDISNTLFISNSPPMKLDLPVKAQRYALQLFNGPDDNFDGEFFELQKEHDAIVTYQFKVKSTQYIKKLGKHNVEHIQGPSVPKVYDTDNFYCKNLLWTSKVLQQWLNNNDHLDMLSSLFSWIASKLKSDEDIKLQFLLGEVGNLNTPEDVASWFWSHNVTNSLKAFKDQVEFPCGVSWEKVLEVISKGKLIINPHVGYGGPPFEAAAFGIPIILIDNGNPFIDENNNKMFDEVLSVNSELPPGKVIEELEKLFTDHSYYKRIGDAMRNFTEQNATYQAYVKQLDDMCKRRGWM